MSKYDDAQYTTTREIVVSQAAGAAAKTQLALYAASVLQNAYAVSAATGTSSGTAGGASISVVVGTTTAGVIGVGSSTAGTLVGPVSLGATVCPAGTVITLINGTDATAKGLVTIEYQNQVQT